MTRTGETWVACLTPPGTAAIATLCLHGPLAWSVASTLFQPNRSALPEAPEAGRLWLGRLRGEVADEVVLTCKNPTTIEIHCHGGQAVVQGLLDSIKERGLGACSWREMQRLTTADPLQATAAIALCTAPTTRTAAILLDQYQGAFAAALDSVLRALEVKDVAEAERVLAELKRHDALGRHLTAPWRVVVAGAPNVGKSSLVNALAGFQRSIVSSTPGTTRDVVGTLIAVDGWPVDLFDTAGLRAEASRLEQVGITRARASIAEADLCLWVLDASAVSVWPDVESPMIKLVVNKTDLPAAWDLETAAGAVRVSALTGAGLEELCSAVSAWLVPEPPRAGAPVPFTPELCDGVNEVTRFVTESRCEEAAEVVRSMRNK